MGRPTATCWRRWPSAITPRAELAIVALNGPTALIGIGQTLRRSRMSLPASTDYQGSPLKDPSIAPGS